MTLPPYTVSKRLATYTSGTFCLAGVPVAKMLGMSQPAVSKAVHRGGKLPAFKGYSLSGERKL